MTEILKTDMQLTFKVEERKENSVLDLSVMEKKIGKKGGSFLEICWFNQGGQKGAIWVDVIKMRK